MTRPAENKELVRAFHHRLWVDREIGVIDEMIAADATAHWGDSEADAATAVRADVERYFTAFTDVRSSIDDLIGENDKVVLRWTTAGTHSGHYGRVPPTGRRVTMAGVDCYRIADGRIAEAWSMWDALGAYRQLGLLEGDVGP